MYLVNCVAYVKSLPLSLLKMLFANKYIQNFVFENSEGSPVLTRINVRIWSFNTPLVLWPWIIIYVCIINS